MSLGLDFILRANSAGFTRAMAGVNNSVKDLKKGLRDFDVGNGFKQALGVGGVIAGFRAAITNAQELRDEADKIGGAVDKGTRSVAEFGDALGRIGTGFKNVLTEGLSFFTGIGDSARHFFQGVTQDQEDAARKMATATGKAADEAEARLKKSREENSPERQAAAQEKLDKARREGMAKGTAEEKKLVGLINERMELEDKLAKTGKATVAYKELQAEIERNQKDTKEANASLDKDSESKAKKKKDDKEKADDKQRKLAGQFGPSVEDLAAMETGGFVDGNDPRLKARKLLEKEQQAKAAFGSMDFKGGIKLAGEAQGMRSALEDEMAGIKKGPAADQPTAAQMDTLIKAVGGIIKASP